MAYAPLDEHFDEHPKYEPLELEHFGLMACAIAYCNRNLTDGKVTFKAVRAFGRSMKGPRLAKKLVAMGIWRDTSEGWEIVGYLDHNPSREYVLAKREAERVRKGNYRKGPGPAAAVPAGPAAGQAPGQPAGQDAGQIRPSHGVSLARAPAPARPIHCTPLHGTTIQEDPPIAPRGSTGRQERIVNDGTAGMLEAVAAFEAAVSEATGKPHSMPNERSDRAALALAINTHLRGDETVLGALAAMRGAVAEWVDAYRDKPALTAGWAPRKFRDWVAAERDPGTSEEPAYTATEQPEKQDDTPPISDADRAHMRSRLAELRGALTGKFLP
jgi:hypothetical protein